MKYWFISNAVHTLHSVFNFPRVADSTPELAGVVSLHLSTPKQDQNWISKATWYAHQYSKTLLAALSISATMAGTEAKAQNSATINPDYYSISNPFVVPNLPNQSNINIRIKTWKATPITMDDLASGQSIQIQNPHWVIANNDIITLNEPGVRSRRYKNKNWVTKIIDIDVSYQADIFDRTENSLTENLRPEIIRVDADQQAELSAGEKMKYYKRKAINDANFETWSATDSIKIKSKGQRVVRTNDWSWIGLLNRSNDTIAVLQKPTIDKTSKTYKFPTTENGITYRLYKYDLNGSKTIADSTRTMVESFVWDGNPHTTTTPLSDKAIYRVSAQRTAATDEDTHLPSFITNFGTGIEDISFITQPFKIVHRHVILLHETPYELYSLTWSKLMAGKAAQFNAPAQAGVYLLIIENKAYKINISP